MPLREVCCERFLWWCHKRKESLVGYVQGMRAAFSTRFLMLMFFVQCFLNGVAFMTIVDSMFPLFKSLGMDPSRLQILVTLAMAPWSLKPLMGILSDSVALGRFHKRYWMVLSCGVGIVGASLLVTGTRNVTLLVMMFFCVNYQISSCDLLVEGKFAELMNANPGTGSNIVTLKSGMQQLGFITAMGYVGPLADEGRFTVMYVICLCFLATPIVPLLLGWLPEEKIAVWTTLQRIAKLDVRKLKSEWKIILFVALIGVCGPCVSLWMAFSPLQDVQMSHVIGLSLGFVILAIGIIGGYCVFPHLVGHVVVYQIVTALTRVDVGTALDFFYTASPECLPNGPHFSYKYYITLTGTLGTCVGFMSVFVYQWVFSKWKFRNALIFATLLSGVAGIFDVVMVKRWNLAMGIPDKAFYVIGEAILERAINMLLWIPSSTIIGKVCPKGLEAATYAYLAGMSNFARTVSSLSGAMAINWAQLRMNPPTTNVTVARSALIEEPYVCEWSKLWLLVVFGHVVLPTVGGLVASFLIPNVYQTENLTPVKKGEQETTFYELDELDECSSLEEET